jgi:hypothetical protein
VHFVDDVDLEMPLLLRNAHCPQPRTCSTPLLLAPSISRTSRLFPAAISLQLSHTPHGVTSSFTQLSAFARIRAVDVLPIPRGPTKVSMRQPVLLHRILERAGTWACPTRSSKVCGRYLRANLITHFSDSPVKGLRKQVKINEHEWTRMDTNGGKVFGQRRSM